MINDIQIVKFSNEKMRRAMDAFEAVAQAADTLLFEADTGGITEKLFALVQNGQGMEFINDGSVADDAGTPLDGRKAYTALYILNSIQNLRKIKKLFDAPRDVNGRIILLPMINNDGSVNTPNYNEDSVDVKMDGNLPAQPLVDNDGNPITIGYTLRQQTRYMATNPKNPLS